MQADAPETADHLAPYSLVITARAKELTLVRGGEPTAIAAHTSYELRPHDRIQWSGTVGFMT